MRELAKVTASGLDWQYVRRKLVRALRENPAVGSVAQQAGLWPRLKLCHNADCRCAFFDTSRNNSGVWHDVSTCGNTANLRAFRERKRLLGGSNGDLPRPTVQGPDRPETR